MICNRRRKVNFIDPYARRHLSEAKMLEVCFRGRFRSTAAWCLIRCEANPAPGEAVQPMITALGGLCSRAWRLSSGQPSLLRKMMNPVEWSLRRVGALSRPARMQLCRRYEVAETGQDDVAPPLCTYSRPRGPAGRNIRFGPVVEDLGDRAQTVRPVCSLCEEPPDLVNPERHRRLTMKRHTPSAGWSSVAQYS